MAKVKNKRNSGLADKVHGKKRGKEMKKKINPFEVHVNKEKIKVLGQKSKHDRGLPGVSRAKAIKKRKETLGTEMKLMHKTNTFIDRRIGEKNSQLSAEDKIVARFAAERAKQHSRKNIYNLADDEILTHRGQTLEQIEKFDDPRSSDEEDDDDKRKFGGLDDDFVAEGHFGGGVLSKTESRDGAKSHKDLIEQLIAESKKRKAEKQKEKEQTLDLTEKLDSEWSDLQPVVLKKARVEEESLIDKLLSQAEKKNADYDKAMRELRFDRRATPSNGLKSEQKIAEEEKKKLDQLEKEREQRMLGEQEAQIATNKHRSADDLDDNFELEDEQDFMLAYDNEGKPLVPENVLKDYHVPNTKKQFKDSDSDASSEDDSDDNEDEADEESDDEIDDQEKQNPEENKSEDESDCDENQSTKVEIPAKLKDTPKKVPQPRDKTVNKDLTKIEKETAAKETTNGNNESENSDNEENEDIDEEQESDDENEDTKKEDSFKNFDDLKHSDNESEQELDDKIDKEAAQELDEEVDTEAIESFFSQKSDEGDNLQQLLTDKTPAQQAASLQQLIKKYDPSLSETNKDKLSRLFAHLLQYINDLFSNLTEEAEVIKSFLIFDKIAPFMYDLAHLNKVSTKKYMAEVLKEKYDDFKRKSKKVPDLDTIIFFKLVSLIYPTSDFKHPVTTPSLIFMAKILSSCQFRDVYSVSRGLFITTLILEYTVLSKRLVPEAINFLRGILYISANTSVLNPIQVVPPFRLHKDEKILNLEDDCTDYKMVGEIKMSANDLVLQEPDNGFKIRSLSTSVCIMKEFFDYFNDLEAQLYLFEPHIQLIGRIDLDLYPKRVADRISGIVKDMKQSLELKTFTPLTKEFTRPKALRLYEPDFQDVFTGSKTSKMSREQVERSKLEHKYKKEMKGALREIRRDKSYIASVKIRDRIRSDNLRKDKVKQIYKDASIQQGELNKLKRMK